MREEGIDNWAHIGGLIGGIILAWFTTPRYAVRFDVMGRPERIEDQTTLAISWAWYGLYGILLMAVTYFLIMMQR